MAAEIRKHGLDGTASAFPPRYFVATVLLLGLVLFAPSLDDGFHFDDELIIKDSNVTNSGRWHQFVNPFQLRQLTFFSFYLNYLVGGDDAFGYHGVNVLLHLANALLIYRLLIPLLGGWIASSAGLIFLVHPIQTEAVLYVYQRSTLLATFFSLLALLTIGDQNNAGGISWRRKLLVFLLFFLAFESKESALAVPLVVALVMGIRTQGARRIVTLVGAVGAATLGLLVMLGEETVGIGAVDRIGPWSYFLTETRVVYTYLRLLVFPYSQSLEYDFPPVSTLIDPPVLVALGGLILMGYALWRLCRHPVYRWAGLTGVAFWILLAPTSSLIPSYDFAFEHRLYMPMLGFAPFAAFWIARVPRRAVVLALLVGVLGALTVRRGSVWASEVLLWEDTALKASGKARVWFNLGGAYLESNPEKARDSFLRAIEIEPRFPEAFYNMGVIDQGAGDNLAALGSYQRALEQDPEYWPAVHNMGNVRFLLGDHSGALEGFGQTLRMNPDYWPAQYNLAIVYTAMDRPSDAVPRLRIVLDWEPDFGQARYLLATSLERLGRDDEARAEFARLRDQDPQSLGSIEGMAPLPAIDWAID